MAATLHFREALNKAIVSGAFVDTKIILFSRRDSSGRVHEPKALYASSHVLKSIPYFNDLLFGNFSEAELRNFDDDIGNRETTAEDYGYNSDSDLEDDEDEKPMPPVSNRDDSSVGSFRESHRPTSEESPHENNSELSNKGRIVRISDIAYVTFQGFILYLYTGQIEFAPLGSRKNRSSGAAEVQISSGDKVSRASPKSVYRLADKYDVPALKNLALNCIRNELKGCDIVEETFSEFASRYEDIKLACVTQLVSALRNDTEEKATWMKVCEVLDGQVKVDHRHVTDTLSLLWGAVNRDERVPTTIKPDGMPPPTHPVVPSNWNAVQAAMVKSIREGIFLDRKYWTRYSKFGGVLKEVYFSSVVLGNELETRIARSHSKDTIMNDHVGDADAESDCESDAVGTEDSMTVGKNDQYAVLFPGPYSAWRSLFFYLCTGQTSFAPLRSQGADSRMRYILKNSTADLPPPCSPKSVYILANLLNIEPLRNIALEDIERKLSENNIVEEFFSCITANQPEVVEMECRLLLSKFKTETTISRAQDKISAIPENHLAHHASAFKLGLRAALDRTRPDPRRASITEGAELRCYSIRCTGHTRHIPYSLVTGESCPVCRKYIMQCVSCGRNRIHNSAECGSCGKRFL